VTRDDPTISGVLKEIEGLRAQIDRKEKEYAAVK